MTNATHDPALDADGLVLCRGSRRGCSVESFLDAAADAGFDGVSLYFDDVAADPARVRALLDDRGLLMAELDGPMRWTTKERSGPSIGEMLDAAAILRARSVTVVETAGDRPEVAGNWNAHADAFGAVCEECATRDLLAHIEFFPLSGITSFGVEVYSDDLAMLAPVDAARHLHHAISLIASAS